MSRTERLWRGIKLAGAAWDLTVQKRRYQWDVALPNTLYLEAEQALVQLSPHNKASVEARIELRGGIAWQLTTDQDEAGVYIIARRKSLLGSIAGGKFRLWVPRGLHISLRLTACQLRLDDLQASIDFAPDLYESP